MIGSPPILQTTKLSETRNRMQHDSFNRSPYLTPGPGSRLLLHMVRSQPHTRLFFFSFLFTTNERSFYFLSHTQIRIQLRHKLAHFQSKWSRKLTRRDLILIFPVSEYCGDPRHRVICPASFIDEELEGSWGLGKSRVLQINLPISFIFLSSSTRAHTSWTAVLSRGDD